MKDVPMTGLILAFGLVPIALLALTFKTPAPVRVAARRR